MLFIYFLVHRQGNLHNKAKNFFTDIENGKIVGIVTSFTIMEYISVLKILNGKATGKNLSDIEIFNAKDIINNFISSMGIILYDADNVILSNYGSNCCFFSDCEAVIDASGIVRGKDGDYRGVGGADAIHVVLAQRLNANIIVSNDDGFKGLTGSVRPWILREKY